MVYIGLDPSFSRTGYCELYEDKLYKVDSITAAGDVDRIHIAMQNAYDIAAVVRKKILTLREKMPEESIVIGVEYPILATRSGSYLGLITAKLDGAFRSLKNLTVYYIPSVACKSVTKAKTKTELVKWVKESEIVNKFKGNHDEATAVVLAEISRRIHCKEYKNSFFLVEY